MNARSQVFELRVETRQVQEAVLALFHSVLFHRTFPKYNFQSEDPPSSSGGGGGTGGGDSWVLGTLGFEDVDCEHIDFTYVRTQSPELDKLLRSNVADFYADLRGRGTAGGGAAGAGGAGGGGGGGGRATYACGQVSLEFYQKRRKWPFQEERVPWEVWTVRTEVPPAASQAATQNPSSSDAPPSSSWQERVGEMLADKVMYVAEVINRQDYVPVMYDRAHLELIYDTSFADVQPYLFKVSHSCSERPVGSMGMGLGGGLGGLAGQDGGGAGGGPGSPSVTTTVRRLLKDTLAI